MQESQREQKHQDFQAAAWSPHEASKNKPAHI